MAYLIYFNMLMLVDYLQKLTDTIIVKYNVAISYNVTIDNLVVGANFKRSVRVDESKIRWILKRQLPI